MGLVNSLRKHVPVNAENPLTNPPIIPAAKTKINGSPTCMIAAILDEKTNSFCVSRIHEYPIQVSPTPRKPAINAFKPEEGKVKQTKKDMTIDIHQALKEDKK